jgi:hypothetical protein
VKSDWFSLELAKAWGVVDDQLFSSIVLLVMTTRPLEPPALRQAMAS